MPAKSKSDVRSRFVELIHSLTGSASSVAETITEPAQRKNPQLSKNGWSGDVFDIENIGKPFSTDELTQDMRDTVKDPSNPGVSGDYITITMQGDYLGTSERAFRLQNQTRVRSAIHAAARRYGHGHEAGLFAKGIMGQVQAISKASKDE